MRLSHDQVRRELQERSRALMRLQAAYVVEQQELDGVREPDPVDAADAQTNADFIRSLSAAERAELREIHRALQRLDAGTYGYCASCGAAIDPRRLVSIPWTSRCVECADAVVAAMS